MKKTLVALFVTGYVGIAFADQVVDTDIVVVGAGGAGFSAAVAAAEAGAKNIVLLEKNPVVGGHTVISGGSVNAVDTKRQKAMGIEDSADKMAAQTLKAGDYRADPALVKTLADNSEAAINWMEGLGVQWNPRVFEAWGGLFARSHNSGDKNAGHDYIRVLNKAAKAHGVQIKTNTKAVELLRKDDQSPVTGVVAQAKNGEKITYNAKAVVLATGGFTANVPMRMRYDRRLDASFKTTANPTGKGFDGSTGDGINMATKVGADTDGMNYIQLIPFVGGRVIDYVGGDIFVDPQGKRFVNEGGRRDAIADAVLALPGRTMWVITDDQSLKGASLETKLKKGIVFKADTVEEMAKKMNVDPKVLQQTLDRYNEFAAKKEDPDFGKTTFTQLINKPPYYFGTETQDVHFSCGGLRITPQAQVVDVNGKVIPGLYAAGETTGGIHGTNRAGGNALIDNFVFGRIAGQQAAAPAAK